MKNINHSCPVIVFACIDWRLHPDIEELLKKRYGAFDLCVTVGAVKGFGDPSIRDFILNQIEVSQKLHGSRVVVLVMHRDCGAYGGSGAFADGETEIAHHSEVLEKTAGIIKTKFSDVEIESFFADLKEDSGKWQCELLPV